MKAAEHVLVAGPSGGGKTTYVGEMHAKASGPSIFLSTKDGDSYPEDISRARNAVIDANGGQVIVDECQNAPTFKDGADGPTRKMLHEDRERGVKCVLATQNPQDLRTSEWRYGPLQQCQYFVWVGPARTWHRGFREWLHVEADMLPNENFDYAVIEPSDPPKVAHSGVTDPQYHL
jgi:hypothetical protein